MCEGDGSMELRHIRYFVTIAGAESISAASARLRVAQSALSARMAGLEAEFGVKLFLRHGRGIRLTTAGKIFLTHAQRILAEVDRARRAMSASAAEPTSRVVLGLPSTIAMMLTVPVIELMQQRLPRVELKIVEGMNGDIQAWLSEGRLDVAIIYLTRQRAKNNAIPLVDDDMYLVGPTTALTMGRKQIAFALLPGIPLIHTSAAHAGRILLNQTAQRTRVTLNYTSEVDSLPQLKTLVYRGHGHTVLPMTALQDIKRRAGIQTVRVVDPVLTLRCSLAFTPKRKASRATRDVAELIQAVVERLLREHRWPGGRPAHSDMS
jgi:LysR family transcriptional regulator, nitrogen assimilation regulatory protein